MAKFTMTQFLMGRIKFEDLTPEMKADAQDTIDKANALMDDFYKQFPDAPKRPLTSGYRSPSANAAAGGAAKSKHMICQAIDIADPDGKIDKWLTMFPDILIKHDLYREDPSATSTWTHLQITPPRSKKRTFLP